MKGLPYFCWFPADAEMDGNYRSMSDAEVGFYHRCLNLAWIECGLPADLDELALLMGRPKEQLRKLWSRVGRCFVVDPERADRLINPRQEIERAEALAKSLTNKHAADMRWKKKRDANALRMQSERNATPGYDSDSDSSEVFSGKESVRENPTALVPVSESDGWPKYIGIFLAAGKPLNDLDLEKGLRTWLGMQMADRLSATVDIEAICRATTDVKYIPFPVNHLAGRGWTRAAPSRVLPDPPSKGEKKTTEVLRIMRERQARRAAL